MSTEIIDGVKVTTIRMIRFRDYMLEKHGIDGKYMGVGQKAMFIEDYVEFCSQHNIDTEFDNVQQYVESVKSCLTPLGRNIYTKVVETKEKLRNATSEEETKILLTQLKFLRTKAFQQ